MDSTFARYNDDDDRALESGSIEPAGGIYSLPGVGHAASGVRRFYDDMAPRSTDATEVRFAKEVFRWGSVVTGAAAVAVIVL